MECVKFGPCLVFMPASLSFFLQLLRPCCNYMSQGRDTLALCLLQEIVQFTRCAPTFFDLHVWVSNYAILIFLLLSTQTHFTVVWLAEKWVFMLLNNSFCILLCVQVSLNTYCPDIFLLDLGKVLEEVYSKTGFLIDRVFSRIRPFQEFLDIIRRPPYVSWGGLYMITDHRETSP